MALRRGCAEFVFAPTLKYCMIFFRISFHPRSSWKGFEEDTVSGNWELTNLAWDGDNQKLFQELSSRFADALKKHVESVCDQISK